MVDFAILAPVPLEHLKSGYEVVRQHGYVSFGSQKWELFREVDQLRNGEKVPVLIYPSHETVAAKLTYQVAWVGWCIGHVDQTDEKLDDQKEGHRPPTTEKYSQDNAYGWAIFWRVEDLHPLTSDRQVPISRLSSYKTGHWRKNKPPFGPEIVARPGWFESVIYPLVPLPAVDITEPPKRVETTVNRIIRDTAAAQRLKRLYDFSCQVCGTRLEIGPNQYYAEVHHIRPLGGEHAGSDDPGNMLVLCPNHHALFDYGIPRFISASEVEISGRRYRLTSRHRIHDESVRYHNQMMHSGTSERG